MSAVEDGGSLKALCESTLFALKAAVESAKPGVTEVCVEIALPGAIWDSIVKDEQGLQDRELFLKNIERAVHRVGWRVVEFLRAFDFFKWPRAVHVASIGDSRRHIRIVCEHARWPEEIEYSDKCNIEKAAERLKQEAKDETGYSCEIVRLSKPHLGTFKRPSKLPAKMRLSIPPGSPDMAYLFLDHKDASKPPRKRKKPSGVGC